MMKREVSLNRAKALKGRIEDYLEARKGIPKGFDAKVQENYKKNKKTYAFKEIIQSLK